MHRRPIGRGRWIVAAAAILIVIAGVLKWWEQQVAPGMLPAEPTRPGVSDDLKTLVLFLTAVAALMLIALPYATDAPVAIDRPFSFLVLLGIAAAMFVWRAIELAQKDIFPFPPTQGPGLWIALVGVLIFSRGVFEIFDASHPK